MPNTSKPSSTKIQDMFNDILTIKEKSTKLSPTYSTLPTNSTEKNSSNEETKAVNGNLITDASHECRNREISLISSGDSQLNGHMKLPAYQELSACNISLSTNPISDSRRNNDHRSKPISDVNLLSGNNTQPTLHSNSCSDLSSETEDYFDQESVSTASLSCSPFLPKKIVSLNSAACKSENTTLSSADEGPIVSEASDLETFETTPTSINKDGKWDELDTNLSPKGEQEASKIKREEDTALIAEQVAATEFLNQTTVTTISSWLSRVQHYGFPADVLQSYISDEISYEEDETWWDPNVVRVFDPYYDISPEDIESITEGKKNAAGDPVGQCLIQLSTGDEVYGTFRKGVRQVTILIRLVIQYKV